MRFRNLFLTLLLTSVVLAQTAQPPVAAAKPRPAIEALKSALGLTDQQIQQLNQLRQEEQKILQPVRQQLQEKAKALREVMSSANPDPAAVGALTLELRNLRQQVQQTNQVYHERALALLDAEQKTKLENLQKTVQRMARIGPAVQAATALNLILPPAPAGGLRPGAQGAQARPMMSPGGVR